jgi:hyaluronan synthase
MASLLHLHEMRNLGGSSNMAVNLIVEKRVKLSQAFLQVNLDQALKIIVPSMLIIFSVICFKVGSLSGYLQLFSPTSYASPLIALGASYSLAFLFFQVVRTVLWWRYRSFPLPTCPMPSVTVIIPAYNEGAMVEKAIYSVAASDYPSDRLEIICIDDGSQDDTWSYISRAKQTYPQLIKAIRFPQNRGKREALYAGFTQSRGEYFVTVDSDSVIEPDTLKQILAPMLQDPKVGGVAGNVKVYNRTHNFLTRMLWVRFILSFDFLRASQSMYGFVFCTPGALSAYRRDAIYPILESWRHQTFLGVRCTIGEDRAFTNLILRQGYWTVYQRSAVVYTTVPENYQGLYRMFLRWDRSNFRESLIQLSYMFTSYRPNHRLMPILDFFIRESEFPMTCIFLPLLLISLVSYPLALVRFVTGVGLVSFVLTFYYIRQERDMDFVYGIIYSYYAFLFLRWIKPYAFLTIRNGRWLTR